MTLRKKTLIIIGATLIGLIVVLYATSRIILLESVAKEEERSVGQDVQRVLDALFDDLSTLSATANDWAAWDDTYAFVEDRNAYYIKSNLPDGTFTNLSLNLMLYVHSSGRIVFGKGFDLDNEKGIPVPSSLEEHLSVGDPLLKHPDAESSLTGIVLLPEGPMLIASRPILTSEDKGPIRGTLIMGRYLDSAQIERLSKITHLSFTVRRFDDPQMPADFQAARLPLQEKTSPLVRPLSEGVVAGYALLKDIYGKPILLLRVDTSRDAYRQGQASMRYFVFSLLVIGLVFGAMTLLLSERLVLSRLTRLSESVRSIGLSGDLSERVPVEGRDELSSLAGAIDGMLEALEKSQRERQEGEERYRSVVETAGNVIICLAPDHTILEWNLAAERLYGWKRQEVMGRDYLETFLPEEVRDAVARDIVKVLSGQPTEGFENPVLTRDGGERILLWNATRLLDADGQPSGVIAIGQDITERKRAEEALRKSEENFQRMAAHIEDVLYSVDGETQEFRYVSPAFERLLGYTPEDVRGMGGRRAFLSLVMQEGKFAQYDKFKLLREGRTADIPDRYEIWWRCKDGTLKCLEDHWIPVYEGGRLVSTDGVLRDITERKRAEEKIKESEELYRTLAEAAHDMIFIIDRQDRIEYVNSFAAKQFGRLPKEIIGKRRDELFPPDVSDRQMEGLQMVFETGEPIYAETKTPFPDRRVWLSTWLAPIRGEKGEVRAILGISRDITERKKMEEMLLESEERYRTLFELASDALLTVLPPSGEILDANVAAVRMLGYSKEELRNLSGRNIIAPEVVQETDREWKAQVENRGYFLLETIWVRKDGSRIPVSVSGRPLELGGKTQFQLIGRDITERKLAEEELIRQKVLLECQSEASIDGILVVGSDRRWLSFNSRFVQMWGFPQQVVEARLSGAAYEATLRSVADKIVDPEQFIAKATYLYEHPDEESHDEIALKDGRVFDRYSAPVKSADGVHYGRVWYYRDITERLKMEEELLKARKLESVGILAGGIAHDFNNILTSILGNISLVKMNLKAEGKVEVIDEILAEAEKASLRAKDLTGQLLTFSKGGVPIKKTTSIGEIIKDTSSFALRGSNVRCELSLPDDLWAVEADEGQMSQVVSNLIINAQQAMPGGGTIKIRAENTVVGTGGVYGLPLTDGKYVKISVEDRGIGIPKEHISKIFDPYFTTKQKGSGLGLATAYSIVKKHDGYIGVESELGVGTTFYVYLPISSKEAVPKKEVEERVAMGKGRVLVMDDEEAIRELVSRILTYTGYEVKFAKDGAEAIEAYREAKESGQPFDVVIMDLTIPGGMGGKEAIKRLLEIDPKAKAIVSSGYFNDPIVADFSKYGFSGVVVKPYRVAELSKTVDKVVMET